ncbi:MAG: NACHT domain-containing protein [Oscillatoriophycideae cyanobacterium NC_groundwater_1537_Pr4_S-0.65um_50_18]|nr:NACHT domain-containing protein [Oscillatoriophycideae cyanobacterium NC_groundwater_1537_Pr4_S-0.65um_50_18]
MGKRSLKASQTGIAKAKQAFQRKGWTQEYLAAEVGLETRQSVWKFFAGRPIERHLFIDICFRLDLDWEDIVEPPEVDPLPAIGAASTENWLEQARSSICSAIQQQCGILQTALDMAYPLALEQVYTPIRILPQPNHQRWLEVLDFENFSQFDSLQPRLADPSMTGLEAVAAHSKLMVLGKPGSGKTTFLQFLALQYTQIQTQQIPIYISLRQFAADARKRADFRLEPYIAQQWGAYGLTQDQIEMLLQQGKALVLLDGLDEVTLADSHEVHTQIQVFAETYAANSIVLTSRIAAQEYCFRGFTAVEIADFDPDQITTAVHKWFAAAHSRSAASPDSVSPDSASPDSATLNLAANGLAKAELFLAQLQYPQNQPIRELVTTPIFLHLACLVFQTRSTFPSRPARLYQAGLDILLVRWDSARGIYRDYSYCDPMGHSLAIGDTAGCDLTLSDKISLLGRIAAVMFEQGKRFFEKREVLQVIADYFDLLPLTNKNVEDLWLKSEAISSST